MSKTLLLNRSIFISRRCFSNTSINLNDLEKAKPFASIPSLSVAQLIMRNLPGGKYYNKSMKQLHESVHAEYGPIVKFAAIFGRPSMVITYDANDFEMTLRNEGIWPDRIALDTLTYYRKTRPDIYSKYAGLFSSQGKEWHDMRTIVNPILMQPTTMKLYCTQVDEIAKEFVEIMKNIRNEKSEMPANFSSFINCWSLESIIAVALETRLNILDGTSKDENAKELIKHIRIFFEQSFEYDGKPSMWRYYQTKEFKEFFKVFDVITNICLNYVNIAIKKMETETSNEAHEDGILRKLLKIDKNVAVVMATDMLLAGVDTTATAVTNILYCLAKNPDKQEILRQELMKVLPEKDSKLTPANMRNMPYLRAVIKETMRMLSVITGTGRKLANDVVLSGYHVPKDTHVIMPTLFELSSPKQYPQPSKFIPERWLRDNNDPQCPLAKNAHPFTFTPFGFGSRMCIGKRIADLEMEVLVANVIRNYKLEWHYPEIKINYSFVNIPSSEMKFKVIDA